MSPPRRRSARLRATTPKTPRAAPPSLNSVAEHDELPKLPTPDHGKSASTPKGKTSSTSRHEPSTPAVSSSLKPAFAEMHPSHVHSTMAPPSSALRLGFADIHASEKTQTTPSKISVPSSPFTFTFTQPSDAGLSSRAQQMMDELREEAAKIRADLEAKRERELTEQEAHVINGRRIAKARGKSSRFSAAHMAEFKKMDSIQGHPSAFRALPGKFTPVSSLKRSSSRANLDDLASSVTLRSGIKRSPSKAKLDEPDMRHSRNQPTPGSPSKSRSSADDEPPSPSKRFKQRLEDDASSSRPISRDASSIPRPKSSGTDAVTMTGMPRSHSTVALLSSPTKASAARSVAVKPTITLVKSPSKADLASLARSPSKLELKGMKKSATTNNLKPVQKTPGKRILSPRFERMKSILRGHKSVSEKEKPAAVMAPPTSLATSTTPGPSRVEKALPALPVPATTPRRRLIKRVGFSPTTREAAETPNSPSPAKSGIPRSKSFRDTQAEVHYPTLDSVMAEAPSQDDVSYPDLAKFSGVSTPSKDKTASKPLPPSVPGTFTFRSDHTINFNSTSPTGFGGSPGQSSLRHVRPSILPIPGSFPASIMDTSKDEKSKEDKENKSPVKMLPGISHGLGNKKRHRASTDEEDTEREAAARAAKKQKNDHVPEGEALLAPRLMHSASAKKQLPRPIASPSPAKRRPVLSLSRLNMLSRPKNR